MKRVQHVLDSKGRNVVSVAPEASVLEAVRLMAERSIGSLLVLDDDRLCGIMTERDYARKVIIKGRSSETTQVSEIMTADVMTTGESQTIGECMELMTEKKVRHLPVVDGGSVIGIVSIGDLVEAIIAEQQEEIQHLEQYISG